MEMGCMNTCWKHRYGQLFFTMLAGFILVGFVIFLSIQLAFGVEETVASGEAEETGTTEKEAAPPKGQHYVGRNTCAACHYDKFRAWKHDKHALGIEILPQKYRQDPKCLICHTTGYGEPTGYKDASTPQLAGITCESCHGPGSEHAKLAQKLFLGAQFEVTAETEQKIRNSIALFLEKNTVESKEAKKQARNSIYRIRPGNACVQCHTSKAHQAHMEYDKE
jgi:mono/diheme cytochrome c family protein